MSPSRIDPVDPALPNNGDRSDAMEAMKASIEGHTAQLAGLARGASSLPNIPPFETTYAVPMHCASCVASIQDTLRSVPGVESAKAELDSGLVHVRGTAAPSAVVGALQGSGRDAILRGSGASNSAAVCILEADGPRTAGVSAVRGLARLVQVSEAYTLVDLTLSGMRTGRYAVQVRAAGNISEGIKSLGRVWTGTEGTGTTGETGSAKGELGVVEIDEKGRGAAYIAREMKVWEIIGRGMSVVREGAEGGAGESVCGVLARSAGVWENDKVVCSCSGKTVWQEREEQTNRGML